MTTPVPAPRSRWRQINVYAGLVVFGLPALVAIPALIATFVRFGVLESLGSAGPAAAITVLPLVLWVRYTRRRPGTYTGKVTWAVVGAFAVGSLAFSPLFFWAGPAVVVLLSECLRLAAGPSLTSARDSLRARRQAVTSPRSSK